MERESGSHDDEAEIPGSAPEAADASDDDTVRMDGSGPAELTDDER